MTNAVIFYLLRFNIKPSVEYYALVVKIILSHTVTTRWRTIICRQPMTKMWIGTLNMCWTQCHVIHLKSYALIFFIFKIIYLFLKDWANRVCLLKCKVKRRFRYFWCLSNYSILMLNSSSAILAMCFWLRRVTMTTCSDNRLSNH